MILLVNTCAEKLHYFEFVRPVEDILRKNGFSFVTKHYSEISENDLSLADKVIICGTSLKDNQFLKDIKKFSWLRDFEKPVLGICAGMQLIGVLFGGKLKKKTEIGFFEEVFDRSFLGLSGKVQVYHLHNNFVDFSALDDFEVFSKGQIPQAVKHKKKSIFGVLFHPEVRQKSLISEFAGL
ncbi:hypothetical protein DRJ25_01735 [Candidatus Woesearchaeota archaeon]|nr:MAG: hypothetical protein DRJ25_01735 [Candidatus Woesearchaeota archaeon]